MIQPKARTQGLFTEEIGNEAIVYDQERKIAHRLNPTLALVWKNCDGMKTVADIAAILKQDLNEIADENLVMVSLKDLDSIHLLEEPAKISLMEARASRRDFVQKVGAVGVVSLLLPLVTTMAVPTPAQAATCGGGGSCGGPCSSTCSSSCFCSSACSCSGGSCSSSCASTSASFGCATACSSK